MICKNMNAAFIKNTLFSFHLYCILVIFQKMALLSPNIYFAQ